MSFARTGALAAARQLLRTFASAPEPRRHARMIYSELTAAEGWTAAEETEITALGAWLHEHPPIGALKTRCAEVVAKLGRA